MFNPDDELAQKYLAESCELLNEVEEDLITLQKVGAQADEELVNRIFRAVHSVKGGASFAGLVKIRDLAHQVENVLSLVRSHELELTSEAAGVLLQGCDRLHELVENAGTSNQADIREIMQDLAGMCGAIPNTLRSLLVEDDLASRIVLQTFLSRYGECHVAVNGKEAVEAFRAALEQGRDYGLVCMDVMMPEMDGRTAVQHLRSMEEARGIRSSCGAKIIMTTAVDEIKCVSDCFMELCDAYLTKPIDLSKLLEQMKAYGLVA